MKSAYPSLALKSWVGFMLGVALLMTMGCTLFQKPAARPTPAVVRLNMQEYPDFADGLFLDNLVYAIEKSLEYLEKIPPERTFQFGDDTYSALHVARSLRVLRDFVQTRPGPAALNRFIAEHYRVYRASGQVLFTGYYEPHLLGSLTPDSRYRYPVYALPTDRMVIDLAPFAQDLKGRRIIGRLQGHTVVPYPDRRVIVADPHFGRKARILAWVDDPIDLFFLQIQGSGRIYLTNGRFLRVHYHGSNGHPYRSIGRLLIDQGKISADQISMQRIKAYLHTHPAEMDAVLNHNPSYVFFKTETSGPVGAMGKALTPGRSVAVDRRVFPLAVPAFLQTRIPVVDGSGRIDRWMAFSAFALNQDTGGAIKGPGRVDIFWGDGPYAEIAAGHMQENGSFYLLVLNPDGP